MFSEGTVPEPHFRLSDAVAISLIELPRVLLDLLLIYAAPVSSTRIVKHGRFIHSLTPPWLRGQRPAERSGDNGPKSSFSSGSRKRSAWVRIRDSLQADVATMGVVVGAPLALFVDSFLGYASPRDHSIEAGPKI
ncbi:hypothetical protein HPB50_019746 [Hyalomma asiaticum]|uniref:Uncharacterized protein n=1 Tax=Hyalomma asiaticum TaxID=266040 RepID=A0ACB7RYJ9_HYAAI|nr:hypothetical protein HPB50_019746 [Hyalomma asiaticum]